MEIKRDNYVYDNVIEVEDEGVIASRKFLAGVFSWMFVALLLSAVTAYLFDTNNSLFQLIVTPTGLTGFGYLMIFAPLIFRLVANFGYNRLSYSTLAVLFVGYAISIGVSLSIIFLAYTAASFFSVFITAAVVFAVMAAAGYYTHQDLTKLGSILSVLFIGVFVGFMINWFMGSEQLDYILSFVFVAILVGLTAYYMQLLKRIGAGVEYGEASGKKLALMGAFTLYILFINLFLMLLRLFGRRR